MSVELSRRCLKSTRAKGETQQDAHSFKLFLQLIMVDCVGTIYHVPRAS